MWGRCRAHQGGKHFAKIHGKSTKRQRIANSWHVAARKAERLGAHAVLETEGVDSSGKAALDWQTENLRIPPDHSGESPKDPSNHRVTHLDLNVGNYNITEIFSVYLRLKYFSSLKFSDFLRS